MGLVIVFSLHGSSTEGTSKHTIGPTQDIGLGAIGVLLVARGIVTLLK